MSIFITIVRLFSMRKCLAATNMNMRGLIKLVIKPNSGQVMGSLVKHARKAAAKPSQGLASVHLSAHCGAKICFIWLI